ncbi:MULTISPECIES: GMC oxidoreductase [unclassified Gordonia (in: high G+C Gram-positive bacteria)]|uniref:GMC oxidoreductase n=1 Tax=unclassified Gordonia (in: high G+C Gram-positive bacteria) TaxID=2657482 RepID=UPI001F0D9E70|nr:GMC family oxidoreductase [Gordonia sp. ABSL49_1]MCH5641273.1 GMC oxidoreductase [Gordonia sp. ABSL49_1]
MVSADTRISRRTFLAGTGAVVAGAAVSSAIGGAPTASAQPAKRVRTVREDHRVVVIGSGFGGGVAALRLAQAGVRVLVLERGRWWRTGPNANTFPNPTNPDKRILWYNSASQIFGRPISVEPYVGLLETVVGDNMTAVCAAGVGGGSLVYQGMTLQPDRAVFEAHFPNALDWPTMNRVHYPRVARMLHLATAPDALVNSPNYRAARHFADRVRHLGLPLSKIPMPIDWNYALAELQGKMRASYTTGDGQLGVNNGGKFSVDKTYIAAAQATGNATIRTQSNVTEIFRNPNGQWVIHVDKLDDSGRAIEKQILTTPTLIMGAGSVNTTRLLMRAEKLGHIPDLPDGLGQGWGTNADRIYMWTDPDADFGAKQGGPVVYGSKNWRDPESAFTVIQASMPPNPIGPKTTMLVGYGASRVRGHFRYDGRSDQARLWWPATGDESIQNRHIGPTVKRIAGPRSVLTDTNGIVNSTWHPLGGACMGTVCDLDGRVRGQRGLYVVDGALMPGNSAACNPSMTIAAVAERALDHIVAKDVGTLI